MLGGILGSVKNDSKDDQITEIISDFENQSDFNVSGYVPSEEFDEEYINGFGEFNGKLGDIITNGVNKGIDLFFEFVKKLVS
jgi:hypothetical protein